MKKQLKSLLVVLEYGSISATLLYIVFTFIAWDLNPAKWNIITRCSMGGLWLYLTITAVASHFKEESES